ncbi:hypothetical protein HG531_003681 [Fusarium graminearum]|nr:hypothetical protein HG531_003681 [Fusarium graminearum]
MVSSSIGHEVGGFSQSSSMTPCLKVALPTGTWKCSAELLKHGPLLGGDLANFHCSLDVVLVLGTDTVLKNVSEKVLDCADALQHSLLLRRSEVDEGDREETRGNTGKVNRPVFFVAIVEFFSSCRAGPDDILRSRIPTLGGIVGLAIDTTEEKVFVEVEDSSALETTSGAETLDASLHAPEEVSSSS